MAPHSHVDLLSRREYPRSYPPAQCVRYRAIGEAPELGPWALPEEFQQVRTGPPGFPGVVAVRAVSPAAERSAREAFGLIGFLVLRTLGQSAAWFAGFAAFGSHAPIMLDGHLCRRLPESAASQRLLSGSLLGGFYPTEPRPNPPVFKR